MHTSGSEPDNPAGLTISKRTLRRIGVGVVVVLVAVGAFIVGRGTFNGGSSRVKLVGTKTTHGTIATTVGGTTTTTTPAPPPTVPTTTTTVPSTTTTVAPPIPSQVIESFYADLNAQNYSAAWGMQDRQFQAVLGGFTSWEAGYGGTSNDQLSVVGASGETVDISLTATQTNGGQHDYQGVYYVHDGLITGADVAEVSSTPGPWCSASVDPSYGGWGDIEVNITSNQTNSPISITTAESGATATLTSTTDSYGDAAAIYPAAISWTPGYIVNVTIQAGSAICGTSFTP